jgi:DNA helicase-2/ATP-dependent DNA helicase PcrA
LDNAEIEEERRLCYVGMTRAETRLYLTHAWEATIYGVTMPGEPSRF